MAEERSSAKSSTGVLGDEEPVEDTVESDWRRKTALSIVRVASVGESSGRGGAGGLCSSSSVSRDKEGAAAEVRLMLWRALGGGASSSAAICGEASFLVGIKGDELAETGADDVDFALLTLFRLPDEARDEMAALFAEGGGGGGRALEAKSICGHILNGFNAASPAPAGSGPRGANVLRRGLLMLAVSEGPLLCRPVEPDGDRLRERSSSFSALILLVAKFSERSFDDRDDRLFCVDAADVDVAAGPVEGPTRFLLGPIDGGPAALV